MRQKGLDVDCASLQDVLRRRGGDSHATVESMTPTNPAGSVFVIRLAGVASLPDAVVLSLYRDPAAARRVAIVQAYLYEQGYPTPRVLLSGPDDEVPGEGWVLSEYLVTPTATRTRKTLVPDLSVVRAAWRRPSLHADLISRLQAVPTDPLDSRLRAAGVNLDWFEFQSGVAERVPGPRAADVRAWLTLNRPADVTLVVSHGDLHWGNIVFGPVGASVVDWEISGLAPPERDVAVCMFALRNTGGRTTGVTQMAARWFGRYLSRRYLDEYTRLSPWAIGSDELRWHQVLYSMTRLGWSAPSPTGDGSAAPRQVAGHREYPVHCQLINQLTGIDLGESS